MHPDQQTPGELCQPTLPDKPLSYAEFSSLLAQYKRAIYESIYQAEHPLERLVKL